MSAADPGAAPRGQPSTPAYLRLDALVKRWSDGVTVGPVSLGVGRGEIVALLGPSGSGKTTVLRMLAGFEAPDSGTIAVDGDNVTATPPARRRFGMVFQHYALFPHMDVGDNVAFGLHGYDRAAVRARVSETLERVDLAGFERRKVQELSGGQQQRVALARALAPEPRVLLLDEPLSNLDPALRDRTRRELRSLIKRVGITALFVTHEQEEAFDLGDRIALLHGGRLAQVGTPDDLYERPVSLFAATFVGRANVFKGHAAARLGGRTGAVVVVRPEALRFVQDGGLTGVVTERRYTGAAAFYVIEGEGDVRFEVQAAPGSANVGDRVAVKAEKTLVFPGGGP